MNDKKQACSVIFDITSPMRYKYPMKPIISLTLRIINNLINHLQSLADAISGGCSNAVIPEDSATINKMSEELSRTISELQHSNRSLQESESNYRELVEKAHTIILKMDNNGNITFFNNFAEHFFGFNAHEIVGKNVVGTIVPEVESSGRDLKLMVDKLVKHPSLFASNVNENMKKNGERVWISWSNHQLTDNAGQVLGVLSIGQDMTERKRLDEALRNSEQRFRSYVENANDVVFSLSAEGIFTYVSPQWKEAFGYEIEETIGKPFAPFVHPDDIPGCFEFLSKIMSTGQKLPEIEYRVLHKNGSLLWYAANGSRIFEQGQTPIFIGIGRNITEQKLLQKELLKAQKLESLSVLAAGIAHNFNNVLTGVIGYISYSRKHLDNHEKIAPLLEAAEKSSNRAASLARQLLTFSKGGAPLKKQHSPQDLVQESVSLFLTGTNVVGNIYNTATRLLYVDSQQINQAFNNIILNALHAMPQGGTLNILIKDIKLFDDNIYLLKPGEYVKITFDDSGCGIPPEYLHKVFDPYFTTRDTGSGLGLSTTHSIIAKHGGYIGIESQVDHGTIVTTLLPGYKNIEKNEVQTVPLAHRPVGIKVLLMDDDDDIRDLAAKRLEEVGYQVGICASGEEVVQLYKNCWEKGDQVPVVILDLLIPGGMGGNEAAQEILSIDPMARLVVSSGYSNDPIMADYRAHGFSDVLVKPYTTDELLTVLENVANKSRTGQ